MDAKIWDGQRLRKVGIVIRKPGEGEAYLTPYGDTVTWLAGGDETAGLYTLMERSAPVGSRSEPHAHKRIEAFYVTDGEFELRISDRVIRGGAGTFIIAREGERHGWSVVGEGPGRMMVLITPAAPQAFYRELDQLVRASGDDPLDARAVLDLARQHGII